MRRLPSTANARTQPVPDLPGGRRRILKRPHTEEFAHGAASVTWGRNVAEIPLFRFLVTNPAPLTNLLIGRLRGAQPKRVGHKTKK